MSNHQVADAVLIVPNASHNFEYSYSNTDAAFATTEINPTGMTLSGYRAAWFKFTSGGAPRTCVWRGIADNDVEVSAFSLTNGVWSFLGAARGNGRVDLTIVPQTGVQTYFRIADLDSGSSGQSVIAVAISFPDPAPAPPPADPHAEAAPVAVSISLPIPTATTTTAPATPTGPVNHQVADAAPIAPDSNGTFTYPVDTTSPGFTTAEVNPTPFALAGSRAAWFSYTPSTDAGATLRITASGNPVRVLALTLTGGAWDFQGLDTGQLIELPVYLSTGSTYYFRIADINAGPGQALTVEALDFPAAPPPPASDPHADAPPVAVSTSVGVAHAAGGRETVTVAPVALTVRIGGSLLSAETAPPIAVSVSMSAATTAADTAATIELSAPDDGATVLTGTPDFIVALSATDQDAVYTIEVRYADNAAFTNATTLSAPAPVVDGGAVLTPVSAIPATTYWQARLLLDGEQQLPWTTTRTVTVSAGAPPISIGVTWTVSTGADRPIHLWHIDPPGPDIGDLVTVYGQGFGSTGHLSFGDQLLDVLSWTRVPAADENTDPAMRVIDGDTVTPEHYEVTFIAPVYDGPGAALSVEA